MNGVFLPTGAQIIYDKQHTVKPQYNVSLGTRIFQCYVEINFISREFYIVIYGEGTEYINMITRGNVKWRYVISGFHCI
jgi:hypothetical protein